VLHWRTHHRGHGKSPLYLRVRRAIPPARLLKDLPTYPRPCEHRRPQESSRSVGRGERQTHRRPERAATRSALQELLALGAATSSGWWASPDACSGGCPGAHRAKSQWFQALIADDGFDGRTGPPTPALARRRFCAGSLTDSTGNVGLVGRSRPAAPRLADRPTRARSCCGTLPTSCRTSGSSPLPLRSEQ
jgi:hypothetical protein